MSPQTLDSNISPGHAAKKGSNVEREKENKSVPRVVNLAPSESEEEEDDDDIGIQEIYPAHSKSRQLLAFHSSLPISPSAQIFFFLKDGGHNFLPYPFQYYD